LNRDRATAEEKAALIAGGSQLLLEVLNKPLDSTFVIIDEVEMAEAVCRRRNIDAGKL
jgi:4-oxalocrotonate tautomerase